jgi:hypothetical protein
LDIQQNEIWLQLNNGFERLPTIIALADDFNAVKLR